jgi:tetratricopeptide (TPR) repeat protein
MKYQDTSLPDWHYSMLPTLISLGEDPSEETIEVCRSSAAEGNHAASNSLGCYYASKDNYEAARPLFKNTLDKLPTTAPPKTVTIARVNTAKAAYFTGHYQMALDILLPHTSDDPEILNICMSSYQELGNPAEAIALFMGVLRCIPDKILIPDLLHFARYCATENFHEEALLFYDFVLKNSRDITERRTALLNKLYLTAQHPTETLKEQCDTLIDDGALGEEFTLHITEALQKEDIHEDESSDDTDAAPIRPLPAKASRKPKRGRAFALEGTAQERKKEKKLRRIKKHQAAAATEKSSDSEDEKRSHHGHVDISSLKGTVKKTIRKILKGKNEIQQGAFLSAMKSFIKKHNGSVERTKCGYKFRVKKTVYSMHMPHGSWGSDVTGDRLRDAKAFLQKASAKE